jgi:hypothetical protein
MVAASPRLQTVLAHEALNFFWLTIIPPLPQGRAHASPAVAFELVANRRDRFDDRGFMGRRRRDIIIGRAGNPLQPASFRDGELSGPAISCVGRAYGN